MDASEAMEGRVVRFKDVRQQGIPLMFIDSILPGHQRMNYAVIGDTAGENPEFTPSISIPHNFQIGMFCALPRNGPAYHTHDYTEIFLILSGQWRFYWGADPEGEPDEEVILDKWDMITLPPKLWRGFEVVSERPAWGFAVLDPHTVFSGKDPYWAPQVIKQAAERGFGSDEMGKMIKPENYSELRAETYEKLWEAMRDADE